MDIDIPITIGLILAIFASMGVVYVFNQYFGWPWKPEGYHRRRRHHLKLFLVVHFHNLQNTFIMANSVTLTDLLPHKGVISVVDQNNNSFSGKLSNIVVASSDATVDQAAVDPNQPNTIDVTAVTKTGGSTLNFTADFTPDIPIDGQTSFTGLKGLATVVNNVTTQLSLQINF